MEHGHDGAGARPHHILLTIFRQFSGRWKIQAIAQLVAILVLVVRGITIVNTTLNKEWDIKQRTWLNSTSTVCPQMLLSVNVVFLGLLLSVLYTVSVVNCLYWLGIIQQQVRENILRARRLWCKKSNILVLGATCVSVFDAFWFFLFVREVWTYRFDVAFQVLQLVPSVFVIFDTIFNGLLICAMSVLDGDQQATIFRGYRTDINTHMGSNILLAMYAVTNLIVARKCHGPGSTFITEFVPLFVVFELICRNFLVYQLGVIRDATQDEPQEENENEILNQQPNMPDNEDYMINDREEPLLDDRFEVDSNNLSPDDSAASSLSSYTGSANECFDLSVICSEDAEIHRHHTCTFPIVINSLFITHNTQCGGESEEPLNIFPDIGLED